LDFTYNGYIRLLNLLKEHGYCNRLYTDPETEEACCILRHDIDYDLRRAVPFAEIENEHNVKSTYFVLLTTDFYNVLSSDNQVILHHLAALGHDIGLHFDEMNYPKIIGNIDAIKCKIVKEMDIMQQVLGIPVRTVSMHRPSKGILEANLDIPGVINSYSAKYFHSYKYVSDSRRRWREPVEDIVCGEAHKRMHILTHPFWYNEAEETLADSLQSFIRSGEADRYDILNKNFTDLSEALA